MFDTQLIHAVVQWERRLEIEEENRRNRRFEDDPSAFLAAPQPVREERRSIFARIFGSGKQRQPAYSCPAPDPCVETH